MLLTLFSVVPRGPVRLLHFLLWTVAALAVAFALAHVRESSVSSLYRSESKRVLDCSSEPTLIEEDDLMRVPPQSLLDAAIVWRTTGPLTVEGTFTNRGQSVTAELVFDERGDLVTFHSNDRFESADGVTYQQRRWSTPASDYRWFDGLRLPAHGEAVWSEPEGELVYARFDLESLETNVGCPRSSPAHLAKTDSSR